jgi:hypothetical protein
MGKQTVMNGDVQCFQRVKCKTSNDLVAVRMSTDANSEGLAYQWDRTASQARAPRGRRRIRQCCATDSAVGGFGDLGTVAHQPHNRLMDSNFSRDFVDASAENELFNILDFLSSATLSDTVVLDSPSRRRIASSA